MHTKEVTSHSGSTLTVCKTCWNDNCADIEKRTDERHMPKQVYVCRCPRE